MLWPRNAGQEAPRMNQFSFEFNAQPEPENPASLPVETKPVPAPQAPAEISPPLVTDAIDASSLEAMAQRLEQDAGYRVLRRLVPVTDYGPPPEGLTDSRRVLVLDTETTGLSHQADKIIELAMLLVSVDAATGLPFGPVELFEGFEDPGMPIPAIAKEITGITDQMVAGQRLDDGWVAAMVARADVVIAHNAGFDRPFVEARFPGFAAKAWACSFKDIDWKAAGAGSSKLSALAGDQGWFYDAHRAQVDCHALLQVLTRPLDATGITGLSQLMGAASRPSFKLSATGSPFESKDVLKARGYRWDAEAKVWGCALATESALDEELAWLSQAVYGGRRASVDVEPLDGTVRYSARQGLVLKRRL
jgi:DNA polymerase-3 subunit epsilon